MADEEKLLNLAQLFFEIDAEDISESTNVWEDIDKEFEEAGIVPENSEQNIFELIKKSKAEVKIENGKKLKENFYTLLADIKSKLNAGGLNEPELATAFRKLEENGSADLLDDKEKMLLLEFIKSKEEGTN